MNHFQYTVTMNEIGNLKTKKAKREMLDRLYNAMVVKVAWGKSTEVRVDNLIELSLLYKCVWKILTENGTDMYFSSLTIPDYLTRTFLNLEAKLCAACILTNQSKEFVEDTFQFKFKNTATPKLSYLNLQLTESIFSQLPSHTRLLLVNSLRDSL